MSIKGVLTKLLFRIMPEIDRQRMASDLITWLEADLPHEEQQEMIKALRPNLLEFISEGRIGLSLMVFHHLLRIFTSRWR